jgi:tryptophan 2,3-dioxygenase
VDRRRRFTSFSFRSTTGKYANLYVSAPIEPSPDVQRILLAVYRDDPKNAELCERLVDLDEGIQEWRYRHVKMVERTIGTRRGTGGSAGAAYLQETVGRPLFPDLWEIRSQL